jgi:hypothetical protein
MCLQLNRPIQTADLPLLDIEGDEPANDQGNGNGNSHIYRDAAGADPDLTTRPYNELKWDLVNHLEREYVEKVGEEQWKHC